jgi:hypothetical protein
MAASSDQRTLIKAAGIPPSCYSSTLLSLRQPLLRSVVADGSFSSPSGLNSYILLPEPSRPGPVRRVLDRFAAEICLTGKVDPSSVCYIEGASLGVELQRYASGASMEDTLYPKVYDSHTSYFVIPDLQALANPAVGQGFLLNHVVRGGGFIASVQEQDHRYEALWAFAVSIRVSTGQ